MPDVRQLLHRTGDAQPVPDLDLDALVGRLRSRRRRQVVLAAAAAVLVVVAGAVAIARSTTGGDGALPPAGEDEDELVTVAPDPAAFLETYVTSPYFAKTLMVAPVAHLGDVELVAIGTIERVEPRGVPGNACRDPGSDPSDGCPDWYLDVEVRVDEVILGPVEPGATITLPLELDGVPAEEAADPPTPAETAAALVEVAPVGHRAIVFAEPGRDGDGWRPTDAGAIAAEDGAGFVPTWDPDTEEAIQLYRWDDYLAQVDSMLPVVTDPSD